MRYRPLMLAFVAAQLAIAGPEPVQRLFVYLPQSDEQTAAALKVFDRYPNLRVVWAVSPRFLRNPQQADLKTKVQDLEKQGRIALALQIPNAPLLPLLLNTADAQGSLPADAVPLSPPYASSDDVVQHIAQARNDFVKNWGTVPRGIILPFGAVSPALARWFQSQSFNWVIAALGVSDPQGGPYVLDVLLAWKKVVFWDGALPQSPASHLQVTIWDERYQKGSGGLKTLDTWGKRLNQEPAVAVLPEDVGLPEPKKIPDNAIQKRVWNEPDWSSWIGTPEKNAIWFALFKTRQALEAYQNSGQAQIPRLEAASQELLTAQNSSFMIAAGSATLSQIEREDRTRDFEATLGSVYRLIGQTPPDDLMNATEMAAETVQRPLQPVFLAEGLPDGRDRMHLADTVTTLDVVASTDTLTWTVGLSSDLPNVTLDVYVDINGLSSVGSTALLPGRGLSVRPEDAWEYALSVSGHQALLYRTQAGNTFTTAGNFTATGTNRSLVVILPRAEMRGNIRHWGYRVLVLDKDLHVVHAMERKYH